MISNIKGETDRFPLSVLYTSKLNSIVWENGELNQTGFQISFPVVDFGTGFIYFLSHIHKLNFGEKNGR